MSASRGPAWTVLDFRERSRPPTGGPGPSVPPTPSVPDVLTGAEVAALLRVSKRTVERLNLPSVKLGKCRRYLRDDVLAYLRAGAL
jgi:excisionase family DNA binding protein